MKQPEMPLVKNQTAATTTYDGRRNYMKEPEQPLVKNQTAALATCGGGKTAARVGLRGNTNSGKKMKIIYHGSIVLLTTKIKSSSVFFSVTFSSVFLIPSNSCQL
jgi:hypothetical protein